MGKSAFFKNTTMLMGSNILSGILAFIFTVILSRELGAEGVGLYQLILPMYTMLIYITGGGISVAISRIAAESLAKGRLFELYRTVKVICRVELIWSIIIVALVSVSGRFISNTLLSDSRTYIGLLAFCPALLINSLSSTFKGLYYGVQSVCQVAMVDVTEKILKILIMTPLIIVGKRISLEIATSGAILAISLGEIVSFLLLYFSFKRYKKANPSRGKSDSDYQLAYNALKTVIPVSMEGLLTSIFGTIVVILIPKRLQHAGISYEDSLRLLGKLQGMALNIVLFPMLILTAFNTLLIPSIAESLSKRNNQLLFHRINTAIGLGATFGSLTTAIIMSSPIKIGCFFYRDYTVGSILAVLAPVMPIIYIELLSYPIINGIGKQSRVLANSFIVQALDMILIYIFVGIKTLNIYGYVVSITISSFIGIILNYKFILYITDIKFKLSKIIIIPFFCGIITYITGSKLVFPNLNVPMAIALSVIIFFSIYLPVNNYVSKRLFV